MFFVITFPSTYQAISFEEKYKKTLDFTLMPVPREISSSCGIAARLRNLNKDDFLDKVTEAKKHGIQIENIYTMKKEGKKNILEQV